MTNLNLIGHILNTNLTTIKNTVIPATPDYPHICVPDQTQTSPFFLILSTRNQNSQGRKNVVGENYNDTKQSNNIVP
jgi:hypothetical protein